MKGVSVRKSVHTAVAGVFFLGLAGCATVDKSVSSVYDSGTGITVPSKPQSTTGTETSATMRPVVPQLPVVSRPYSRFSQGLNKVRAIDALMDKRVTLNLVNATVENALLTLARNSNLQLDIQGKYRQRLSVRLIDAPLSRVLKILAEKGGFKWRIADKTLIVTPDLPYWKSYEVDFPNLTRETSGTSQIKTNVGSLNSGVQGGSGYSGAGGNTESIKTEVKHNFWAGLKKMLEGIVVGGSSSPNGSKSAASASTNAQDGSTQNRVIIDENSGMVSVYANESIQRKVDQLIKKMVDRSKRQVLIEATVVEVQLSDKFRAGIDWKNIKMFDSKDFRIEVTKRLEDASVAAGTAPVFAATISSGPLKAPNIAAGIRLLKQFGKVRVVSSPKIMAMNNNASVLKVVDNEAYFTIETNQTITDNGVAAVTYKTDLHTVPVGFMMSLVPFVDRQRNVTLTIRPTLTRVVKYIKDPNPDLAKAGVESQIPVIQERELSSTLNLRSGQIAIIGGLMQTVGARNTSGIPGLSDIPGLGELGNYRTRDGEKTELVIFLKPIVVNNNPDIMSNEALSSYKDAFFRFHGQKSVRGKGGEK